MRSYGPDTDFGHVCTVTLTLEIWPWVKVMTHPWGMHNNCVKYYLDPTWQWGVMAGHGFWICVHCDLELGDMTLGEGHDKSLRYGKKLCKILSRSNMTVRSYGQTRILGMCALWPWRYDLGLRSWHTRIMDNNCGKYCPNPTWQWGDMAGTRIFGMCALWPWPSRYDLGSRSWHILVSLTTIVWNIIQIR